MDFLECTNCGRRMVEDDEIREGPEGQICEYCLRDLEINETDFCQRLADGFSELGEEQENWES